MVVADLLLDEAGELRRTIRRLEVLRDHSSDGWALLDERDVITDIGVLETTRTAPAALRGRSITDVLPSASAAATREAITRVRQRPGAHEALEVELVDSRGGRRWLHLVCTNLVDDPAVGGVLVNVRDVTEEREARAAREISAAVLDAVGHAIVAVDVDGRLTYANAATGRLLDRPVAELIGTVARDHVVLAGGAITEVDGAGAWVGEVTVRRPDGSEVPLEVQLTPLVRDGEVVGRLATARDITLRRQRDAASVRLARLVQASNETFFSIDQEGRVVDWNPAAERLLGWSAAEIVGEPANVLVPAERLEEVLRVREVLLGGGSVTGLDTLRLHKDGRRVPVVLTAAPIFGDGGEVIGGVAALTDATERVHAERQREEAELRFVAAFAQSPFGMILAGLDGRPVSVNRAACRMLGRSEDELIGNDWLAIVAADDASLQQSALHAFARGETSFSQERRYVRPDGAGLSLMVHITIVRGTNGRRQFYMAQFEDVTERRHAEAQLAHRAMHDDLTGLPNRALLGDRLAGALTRAARSGCPVVVAFFDLDGFKDVNDALGHGVGDELLVQVAGRLRRSLRSHDTVARFGGDEYVVVCEDLGPDGAARMGARLEASMAAPFPIAGRDVALHASVGVTVSRPDSTGQSLLSEADAAMYRAKELGRQRVVHFDESIRRRSQQRLELEQALRASLRSGGIVTHYQPVVDLCHGHPVGVEALVRWRTDDGRLLSPGDFVTMAEQSGLVVDLGRQVLSDAVAEVAGWNRSRTTPLWVSVNLSATQLNHRDLPAVVAAALDGSGLDAHLLHLEITETALMQDIAGSMAVLASLKDLGVALSIDDFGTGYSSLAYLRQLPVTELKIDQSFVQDLGEGADASIVEAVLGLARAMHLGCIAEGVETVSQRDALVALGCTLGQGYLFARPMAPEAASDWLADAG